MVGLTLCAGLAAAEPLLVLHEQSLESGMLSEVLALPTGELVLASELRAAQPDAPSGTGEVLFMDVATMSYGAPGPLPETASLEALTGSYLWHIYRPQNGYFIPIDGGMASDGTSVSELMDAVRTPGVVLMAVSTASTTPDPTETCGNGTCGGSETCASCSPDCGVCPEVCGNGTCAASETCASCSQDCGVCPEVCGNGTCAAAETCASCPADCGVCSVCGDLDADGVVNGGDVSLLRSHLLDPIGQPLTTEAIARCRVTSDGSECDLLQLSVIHRTVEAPSLSPGIAPVCSAYEGP